jgi:hypothetical protein
MGDFQVMGTQFNHLIIFCPREFLFVLVGIRCAWAFGFNRGVKKSDGANRAAVMSEMGR